MRYTQFLLLVTLGGACAKPQRAASKCAPSELAWRDTCVEMCPNGAVQFNATCVTACPPDTFNTDGICQRDCNAAGCALGMECETMRTPVMESDDDTASPVVGGECVGPPDSSEVIAAISAPARVLHCGARHTTFAEAKQTVEGSDSVVRNAKCVDVATMRAFLANVSALGASEQAAAEAMANAFQVTQHPALAGLDSPEATYRALNKIIPREADWMCVVETSHAQAGADEEQGEDLGIWSVGVFVGQAGILDGDISACGLVNMAKP